MRRSVVVGERNLGDLKMKTWKSRPILVVIGVLLLALVGCSGDSPTEPPKPGTGTPVPPSDSVTISVTVSNVTPTSAVVTATIDGGNAPNGTAVEFETSKGTFLETGVAVALRATEGGRASITVLAAEGEVSTIVRVRVRSTVVDREVRFATSETPSGTPVISSITPPFGTPAGGYIVSIRGRSFFEPLRVFFGSKEAVIASFTPETPSQMAEIRVVVPPIDLGVSTQFQEVAVTVIAFAGTTDERSGSTPLPDNNATTNEGFRYELALLTPTIYAVSPPSGPNEGNTRITILGEAFQSPLMAYFGSANTRVDLEIVSVSYGQIIAITPPAVGLGSGSLNNSVSLTVHNLASNKTATLSNAFRYGPEMQIISISPTEGSALGGTRVTINGFGFDDPVAVTLAGVPAQVIRVSGTEIVVIASSPRIENCSVQGGGSGEVTVTNIEDGQSADGPDFTYIFDKPKITFVSPIPVAEGGQLAVTVNNPGTGNASFRIGNRTVFPATLPTSPTGAFQYTMSVPTGLEFDTAECTTGGGTPGVANAPTEFDLSFQNLVTGCSADFEGGITVTPLDQTCVTAPSAVATPSAILFPDTAVGNSSAPVLVTVTNTGSVPITVSAPTSSNPVFTVGPLTGANPVPAGQSITFTVTFTPTALSPPAAQGNITIPIAGIQGGSLTVAVSGNGI
jgi:hypothetical protein